MLTELDHKLITAENAALKPVDFSIEHILREYHAYQVTCHWYDSMAPECDGCNNDDCGACDTWLAWDGSEEQLTHETWVDIWGVGIWGMTQKDMDKFALSLFREIFRARGHKERLYYVAPENGDICIFYYNRDQERYDYWFIFKKEEKEWTL